MEQLPTLKTKDNVVLVGHFLLLDHWKVGKFGVVMNCGSNQFIIDILN